MTDLFFSRARLRRDVPAAALWRQLAPSDDSRRMQASHRLVWTLFADARDRTRDFLWREADPGMFYFLSSRPPEDKHDLFHVDPPKLFEPALRVGDTLGFSLRANATVARRRDGATGERSRGKPSDVVMDALYRVPKGRERAEARQQAIAEAGKSWLCTRGAKSGFRLVDGGGGDEKRDCCVSSYRVMRPDERDQRMRIGVLDFDGTLIVENPELLVASIKLGFGRAKAFGCGLMMIRRI